MLRNFYQNKLDTDDVFQHQFLSALIFCSSSNNLLLEPDAQALLLDWGTKWFDFVVTADSWTYGPQLLCDGKLAPISRLYDDTAGAFVAFPKSNVDVNNRDMVPGNCIAVQSRAAISTDGERPLQGMRMTAKDMFDIQGHCTGLGSRAYLELAEPATKTAPAIQRLLDLGAQLVGMNKMCAMVGTTVPSQTIDYEAPWNPRADGFQSPSGGSSGQPSALATYNWLDFAIGSDATVSGRLPAQANGVFSLRPTVGTVSTQGMWSAVTAFDTPCIFAREISILRTVVEYWQTSPTQRQPPKKHSVQIYVPVDFLPLENPQQMAIFDSFVGDVCQCFKQREQRVSIQDLWKQNPPAEAETQELTEFLSPIVATRSYVYDFWRKISQFIDAYSARFSRQPFFPPPKGRDLWIDAEETTSAQNEEAWAKITVYKEWLLRIMLKQKDQDAILLSPLGLVSPCYRDEWPSLSRGQQMWEPLLIAPILGAPEVVVPAGEMKYHSRISGCEEFLPVCVSVMGLPGTDLDLLDTVHEVLERSGRRTMVNTGRRMY